MVRFGEYMMRNVAIVFVAMVISGAVYLSQVWKGLPADAPSTVFIPTCMGILAILGIILNTLGSLFPKFFFDPDGKDGRPKA